MKQIICAISFLFLFTACDCGCADIESARFRVIDNNTVIEVKKDSYGKNAIIVLDTETGIEYIVVDSANRFSMTRLWKEGE